MVANPSIQTAAVLAQGMDPDDAGPRLMGGLLLVAFVFVLLSVPALIALRVAIRRRRDSSEAHARSVKAIDPWSESARRMETPR